MDIKEQLEMAVENRELKRSKVNTEVRAYINNYLEENLPKTISDDKNWLKLTMPYSKISNDIWHELIDYADNRSIPSKGSIIKDHVDDVYKPYLKKDETTLVIEKYRIRLDDTDEAVKLDIVFYLK